MPRAQQGSDHGPAARERPPGVDTGAPIGGIASYSVGLVLALLLTAAAFLIKHTGLLWAPGVPVGLAVLAIAQMGVHLVFFLHMSSGPDSTNNVLALAFGILIVGLVIAGSLWIMANLDANMMPSAAAMGMQQ